MLMSNFFTSSLFGSSSSSSFGNLSSLLSTYSSIQSGSYKKLLKSYYATQTETKDSSNTKSNTLSNLLNTNTTTDSTLTSVKSKADELVSSASALTATGSKSLFNKKEITTTDADTGEKTTTYTYDRDAIAKAVNSFVSDYNDFLDSTSKTTNATVLQRTSSIVMNTKFYKNSLESIGITIGADNKLTVDEETLKNADIDDVKNLFQGVSSFAATTSSKASLAGSAAQKAATTTGTYGTTGSYNIYNYNSFSTYF